MAIHAGSASRVLLAAMPRAERDALVADLAPALSMRQRETLTPAALDAVRAAGWTESFEEVDEGIWGVAAAVRSHGDVVASLGTAGPMYRLDDSRRADVIARLRTTASRISADLG
jgi:DNA-binding IclR family transcriptional regulator